MEETRVYLDVHHCASPVLTDRIPIGHLYAKIPRRFVRHRLGTTECLSAWSHRATEGEGRQAQRRRIGGSEAGCVWEITARGRLFLRADEPQNWC